MTTTQVGPQSAIGQGVLVQATASELVTQSLSFLKIGTLTTTQISALKLEIAKSLSVELSYSTLTKLGYVGKYQFGAPALIALGYVTLGTITSGLNSPNAWLPNKDGLSSLNAYWSAPAMQEKIMDSYLTYNYHALTSFGTITSSSTIIDIAGKLAVAHILGASGCDKWVMTGIGTDASGNTGQAFYNAGRYAVSILANL